MREIKFRTWSNFDKKMVFLNSAISIVNVFTSIEYDVKDNVNPNFQLMQYIGLKDKNDVEIYEGDIVQFQHTDYYNHEDDIFNEIYNEEYGKGQVSWGGSYPAFDITELNNINCSAHDCEYNIFSCDCYVIEVIGNIYENPELLEASK